MIDVRDPANWFMGACAGIAVAVATYMLVLAWSYATAPRGWSCVPDPRGADLPWVPWPVRN